VISEIPYESCSNDPIKAESFDRYVLEVTQESQVYVRAVEALARVPGDGGGGRWWRGHVLGIFDDRDSMILRHDDGDQEIDRPIKLKEKLLETLRRLQEYPRARAMLEEAEEAEQEAAEKARSRSIEFEEP
jgi:hypothetical protein